MLKGNAHSLGSRLGLEEAGSAATLRRHEAADERKRAEARQGKTGRMPVLSVKALAANVHQRVTTNLGFVVTRPKERRAGCPCFP